MLTPIPPSSIFFFIQAGYDAGAVFRVLVQSINGIRNSYGGIARNRPADQEFYLLIEKLRRVQDSGAYEIRIQKSTEREALAAVFSDKVDAKTEADISEIRKMLGLDPRAREFRVIYGSISSNDKEIAILESLGLAGDHESGLFHRGAGDPRCRKACKPEFHGEGGGRQSGAASDAGPELFGEA